MARITYTLGELVGSIGDLTFQRNNAGTIIRLRPKQKKSSTSKQTTAHIKHIQWLYEWQQLTQEERDLWNTYSATWTKVNKFGQTKTLTGQNWFESANYYRADLGESILTAPPVHDLPQAPPDYDINITADTISLTFNEAHDYVVSPVIVWVSAPTKRNTSSLNQTRRIALIIQAAPANPLDITSEWEAATGMTWDPENIFPTSNIFVFLQSIRRSAGIGSTLLTKNTNTIEITSSESSIYYYI